MTKQKKKHKIKVPVLKKATFEFDCGTVKFHFVDGKLAGDIFNSKLQPLGRYSPAHVGHEPYCITKTTAARWLRDALLKEEGE